MQNDEDDIRINVQNESTVDPEEFRKFAFDTIPDVVADCALMQNKFHPDNIIDGLVEFKTTEDELLTQSHWNLVILCNYVYTVLYGNSNSDGEQTLFGTADKIVEQIGKKIAKRY